MIKLNLGNDKFRLYSEDGIVPEFIGPAGLVKLGKKVKLSVVPADQAEEAGYQGTIRTGVTQTSSNFSEGGRFYEMAVENAEDTANALEKSVEAGQYVSKWGYSSSLKIFFIQFGVPASELSPLQKAAVEERDAECREAIEQALLSDKVFG